MSRMRRWVAGLVGLVVAGGIGACGVESGGPSSGCTDGARNAGEPGDAEPLLVLGAAEEAPTIVYADGAVVIPDAAVTDLGGTATNYLSLPMMIPGYHGDEPGGFHGGWLTPCELDAVITRADALFSDDVDFGDPQVTDVTSTPVTYRDRAYSIYAFFWSDPTGWDDLSGSQKQARQDLADLWTLVEQETEITGALETDRLFVHFYNPVADEEVVDWPLPTAVSELSSQRCVTVSDPGLLQALLDRLDDGPLLAESEYRIAVVAAAPGVADCEG